MLPPGYTTSNLQYLSCTLSVYFNSCNELQDGSTPLEIAFEKNLLEIATLLIDNGADVNAVSKVRTSKSA